MIGFLLPPNLPSTEAALRDAATGSPESQWVAALALGQEDGPLMHKAVDALAALMESPHEEIRAQALEGLIEQVRHGAKIEETIPISAARDPSPAVRCVAVDALLIFPTNNEAPHLLSLLEDTDPSVRAAAAIACADIGISSAIPKITQLIEEKTAFVRLQAAIALAYLDKREGLSILIDALGSGAHDAIEAARALGHLGTAQAASPLYRIASKRFTDAALKAAAAVSLHRCSGEQRATPLIIKLLSARNTDTRLTALSAIAALPLTGMATHVGKLLFDRDTLVGSTAIGTLAELATVDAPGTLKTLEAAKETIQPALKNELLTCIEMIKGNLS